MQLFSTSVSSAIIFLLPTKSSSQFLSQTKNILVSGQSAEEQEEKQREQEVQEVLEGAGLRLFQPQFEDQAMDPELKEYLFHEVHRIGAPSRSHI